MAYHPLVSTPIFQIDAFATRPFEGNPAAVCVLTAWPEDAALQAIAAENNLSEPAFIGPETPRPRLRWFTPTVEVDLCGHATLAAAWVWLHHLDLEAPAITFDSRSGPLTVTRQGDELCMDLPSRPPRPCDPHPALEAALGARPHELWLAHAHLAVFERESQVRELAPNMSALAALGGEGVICTAPADDPELDLVSRYFVPSQGIDEDPVTGSAHCVLAPYWSRRLDRPRLRARQISARGGELRCELRGDRVHIVGAACPVLEGRLLWP